MKRSHRYIIMILSLLVLGVICLYRPAEYPIIHAGYADAAEADGWDQMIASQVNGHGVTLAADGKSWISDKAVYMDQKRQLMIPVEAVTELFYCNAAVYDEKHLQILRNSKMISADLDSSLVRLGAVEYVYEQPFAKKDGEYFISAQVLADGLGYSLSWDYENAALKMTDNTPSAPRLPVSYDARELDRTPTVRNQGRLGTCWAFAAAGALEAALLPEEKMQFSVDHMSLNNYFGRDQEIGGEYSMAMSYLLAWQGPVLEADDPYGDGMTDNSLGPQKHVQEIRIIPKKDFQGIKEAVYLYGSVQTSVYSALVNSSSVSEFYNPQTCAYFYIGTEKINHDVLIVGWDDNYPRENFNTPPEGNGAFLCMNSWGSQFGEDGYFWVSYFDSNIGIYNIVYSGIEEPDNYDKIYQSDLCGWIGQLGYGQESAYFANAYTAGSNETAEAVGFYAVGSDTDYEVYFVHDFESKDSLSLKERVASGTFADPGYYTVKLDAVQELKADEKFAVIVYIRTPGEERPIAVEYNNEEELVTADLTDGEGYISLKGSVWQSTEEKQECNLCLKVYTTER